MSIPMVTLNSGSNTLVKRASSFHSYTVPEETFVLQLEGKTTNAYAFNSSTPQNQNLFRKGRIEDKEIDVFNAEKYFKETLTCTPPKPLPIHHLIKKDDPFKLPSTKEHPPVSTPSVRSVRSCNSRSALLRNISRNHQVGKTNTKNFLASINCINCSCRDKKSVKVGAHTEETCSKNSSRNENIHVGDKKRVHSISKSHADHDFLKLEEPKVDENNYMSLKNKLAILSWDEIAPGFTNEVKIPPVSKELDDDSFSDTSSDLFEIESLTKGDSLYSSTCYAPSEASIEWSVVTASAEADFSQELKLKSGSSFKGTPKRRSSILSGCKSYKSVRVAGDAQRSKELNNVRRDYRSESFTSMTRIQEETKVANYDARNKH